MKGILGSILLIAFLSVSFKPILKTNLRITILNELGNAEDSVEVTLYTNNNDYRDNKNPAVPMQYTDVKGRATFKGLEPIEYYIHAQKGDKTNVGAGVVAGVLKKDKLNKLTIIIE